MATTATEAKSLVPDPGSFDRNWDKFNNWWRGIQLFLNFHKIKKAHDRVIATVARMKGGTAGYFANKWTDKVTSGDDTIDWDLFKKKLTTSFQDRLKKEAVEWKIEKYQQKSDHIADFLIKFDALKTKAQTDDAHAIFLLKKNAQPDIIRTILGYPPASMPKDYKG
jgi:hypothetical protein